MEMTGRKVFPKVVIDSVTLDGPTHLPAAILKDLVTSLTHREFDGDPKWLEGIEELPIRETGQDQGYFQAEVSARASLLRADATCQHFSVTFPGNEGGLYRLGAISFRSSDPDVPLVFPPEELRKLIPLQAGNLFSAQKIRDGLKAMTDL